MSKQDDVAQVEALTADALAFLARTNGWVAHALGGPHNDLPNEDQFMLAHRLRMLRFSQAIEATASADLLDPAGALLRVLIELGYVLTVVANDPEKLNELLKQGQSESRKALEALKRQLEPHERDDALTDDYLDAEIAKLGAGSGFVAHNWAGLAGSMGSYATIYRLTSRHSHGGSTGTMDYFDGLDTDDPKLRSSVPAHLSPDYCLTAAALMLDAVTALPLQTMDVDRTAFAATQVTEWRRLMIRNNNLGDRYPP